MIFLRPPSANQPVNYSFVTAKSPSISSLRVKSLIVRSREEDAVGTERSRIRDAVPFFAASLERGRAKLATIFPIKNPPSLRFLFSRLRTSRRERQEEVPEKGSLRRAGGGGGLRADGKIYSSQLPVEINKSHATRSRCAPTTAAIRVQGSLSLDITAPLLFSPRHSSSLLASLRPRAKSSHRRRECSTVAHQDIHEIMMKRSAIRCNRVPAAYCSFCQSPPAFPLCPGENIFPVPRFRVPPPPSQPGADPACSLPR